MKPKQYTNISIELHLADVLWLIKRKERVRNMSKVIELLIESYGVIP